jgi:hypothetical protein
VRDGAPDAAACLARLSELRRSLVERMALVLMAREPESPSPVDVWLSPLSRGPRAIPQGEGGGSGAEGAGGDGGGGGGGGGGVGAPDEADAGGSTSGGASGSCQPSGELKGPPGIQHWVWAVQTRLQLDADQAGPPERGWGWG